MITLSPLVAGCTRSLAIEIADARVRHAAESLEYHSFFGFMTVAELQDILHGRAPADDFLDPRERRKELTLDVLASQQQDPHPLWTLLLVVAFERELVRRRRELSRAADVALDDLVVTTFVAAASAIPDGVAPETLRSHVLRAWGKRLRKAMRDRILARLEPRASSPERHRLRRKQAAPSSQAARPSGEHAAPSRQSRRPSPEHTAGAGEVADAPRQ
jgi:hypothetical protein